MLISALAGAKINLSLNDKAMALFKKNKKKTLVSVYSIKFNFIFGHYNL